MSLYITTIIVILLLNMPNSIEFEVEKHKLRFYSKFKSREFMVENLTTIRPDRSGRDLEFIFANDSKVTIPREIDQLHELITLLKKQNKSIVTEGC